VFLFERKHSNKNIKLYIEIIKTNNFNIIAIILNYIINKIQIDI